MKKGNLIHMLKDRQTWSFRGSKSRNKVSVGEPAEGSFIRIIHIFCGTLIELHVYYFKTILIIIQTKKTSNNGSLGSQIDEERSKLR